MLNRPIVPKKRRGTVYWLATPTPRGYSVPGIGLDPFQSVANVFR